MKISVLTPSFNSVQYLEKAIQSVHSQSYSNWEHIVMDGGSKDGTIEILKRYPKVSWVSEPDKGQSDAMNKAFEKSSGDLIVYLNADDYFAEGAFQAAVEAFEKNPQADMVVGNIDTFYQATGMALQASPGIDFESVLALFNFQFPNNPVGYFYKRKVQEGIGPFPVENHLTMDYWFLLRALSRFSVVKSDKKFGTFFVDGSNKSIDGDKSYQHASEVLYTYLNSLEEGERKEAFLLLMHSVRKLHTSKMNLYKDIESLSQLLGKINASPFFRLYSHLKSFFTKTAS
jgi:glycosyltransferase involved in cell wall biosynthesis